jgi:hypothetical protein
MSRVDHDPTHQLKRIKKYTVARLDGNRDAWPGVGVDLRHGSHPNADDKTRAGRVRLDPTEGIERVEDLPPPKLIRQSRNYRHRPCPQCGQSAYCNRTFQRSLHDTCTCGKCRCVGDLVSGRPRQIVLTYSQHHCSVCRTYFNADTSDLAPPGAHYTHRVMALAGRTVVEDGLP